MEVTLLDVEELQNLGCDGGRLRGKGGGGCFALVSQLLLISWAGFGGPGGDSLLDYKLQPRNCRFRLYLVFSSSFLFFSLFRLANKDLAKVSTIT